MSTSRILLEICVDSLAGAHAAHRGGADRLEICGSLDIGGVTPSIGLLETVAEQVELDVMVMIRPRGGDFCYDDAEIEVMLRDIERAAERGVRGVVFGALLPDGRIDIDRLRRLVERARPLEVTFHRAFDLARDRHEALETLVDLGIERVLTSGGRAAAPDALPELRELVDVAAGRITILPGSGIRSANIREVAVASAAAELHMSARKTLDRPRPHDNPDCPPTAIGGSARERDETDEATVRRCRTILDTLEQGPDSVTEAQ